jgi:hypothetical protein
MTSINELKEKFDNLEKAKKELRNIQTIKCRFRKMKSRSDYDKKMAEILQYEQSVKELVNFFEPKKTFVTQMTAEDIANLNFDETLKAIKSIQSKKCNTQYDDDKTDYNKACEIEKMLLEHKETVKPIEETVVKKSTIQNLINHLEVVENEAVTKEYVIELLQKIMNESESEL